MTRQKSRWWAFRRAQNRSASLYRCPFCGNNLAALSEHMLVVPEGDPSRRRHAHTDCVAEERRAGRLPSFDEWKATQPKTPSFWERLRASRRL